MIVHILQDAFSAQRVKDHLTNPTHDLILLRHLIPWQFIIDRLNLSTIPAKVEKATPCAPSSPFPS